MAEATNQEAQNDQVSQDAVIPEVEQEAREQGWVPKEEYEGDENKWIDAGEFVRRKPLFEKINKQSKKLKELEQATDRLIKINIKTKAEEFQRALATLKAQKKEAFTEGDPDRIIDIDDRIELVKEQQQAYLAEAAQEQISHDEVVHPEFEAWTNRNTWYTSNNRMKAYADQIGRELAGTGKTPLEVLKEVEKQVREEFPQRFKNANREKPGAVESASPKGSRVTGYTPTATERAIAEKFVKMGALDSVEDYYKQLKELN
jgi:hypothetical protein